MNIVVISLERAKERREKIKSQLASLQIEAIIMDAIDNQNLTESEKNKKIHLQDGYRFGELFKPGEIACTMSHIKALRIAKKENWPYLIVLEDDVILAEDFAKRVRYLFRILPNDWEHVYLSGIPRIGMAWMPNLSFMNVVPSVFTQCIHSIIVSDLAYDKVINYLEKFETTTDDSYCHLLETGKLRSYTFYPFVSYVEDPFTYIWNKEISRIHPSKKFFINKMT